VEEALGTQRVGSLREGLNDLREAMEGELRPE